MRRRVYCVDNFGIDATLIPEPTLVDELNRQSHELNTLSDDLSGGGIRLAKRWVHDNWPKPNIRVTSRKVASTVSGGAVAHVSDRRESHRRHENALVLNLYASSFHCSVSFPFDMVGLAPACARAQRVYAGGAVSFRSCGRGLHLVCLPASNRGARNPVSALPHNAPGECGSL